MPRDSIDPLTAQPYDVRGTFRLEPLPRSNEVETGLSARVHDPAWLLTRQWQLGEFAGQDAGSPVQVTLAGRSEPVSAWRPVPADGGRPPRWRRYRAAGGPLDVAVESEVKAPPDLRTRIEGGAQLATLLHEAGLEEAVAPVLAACRFESLPELEGPAGDAALPLLLLADSVPDPLRVVRRLADGTLQVPGTAPVLAAWRRWWSALVGDDPGPDTYDPHRFEHRFELSCGERVLRAEEYLGDGLDWHCVDRVPGTPARPAAVYRFQHQALATPVRYGGLPADRFWEMEDAEVDLAAAEVSTLDTGRMLLVGFAEVYGNDWFMVPLEVPTGSLTTIERLVVLDSFGDRWLVGPAGGAGEGWSLFAVDGADGLLVTPASAGQSGAAVETVTLARDELANTAWAIVRTVTDGLGRLVDRRDEWLRTAPDPVEPGSLPAYAVQTVVPDYWLPLAPEPVPGGGPEAIRFRLSRLQQPGLAPPAGTGRDGRLLRPGQWVHEEEVPREGVQLTRRPVLARWYDGSWHAWTRREKNAGAGESSSGLAFDVVRPSDPWP